MRVCSACRIEKPLEDFSPDKYNPHGRRYACRACEADKNRARRAAKSGTSLIVPTSVAGKVDLLPPKESPPARRRIASRLVLIVGDTHFPWHHRGALSSLLELIAELNPDAIVQTGDLYDLFSFSKYPRSLNILTPNDELTQARLHAEFFWNEAHRLAPEAALYQLEGNHDQRAHKRALELFAAAEQFVEDGVRKLITFDHVDLVPGDQKLEIDGVLYEHGYLKFGAHAAANRQSTWCGHLHRGGVLFFPEMGEVFEANAGWLGDLQAPCFGYAAQRRARPNTTLGVGVQDALGPRFVLL